VEILQIEYDLVLGLDKTIKIKKDKERMKALIKLNKKRMCAFFEIKFCNVFKICIFKVVF